jgi:hypothetical protein
MKAFRIYEYDDGILKKPVFGKRSLIKFDHDSYSEACSSANLWNQKKNNQVLITEYTGPSESRVLAIIEKHEVRQ